MFEHRTALLLTHNFAAYLPQSIAEIDENEHFSTILWGLTSYPELILITEKEIKSAKKQITIIEQNCVNFLYKKIIFSCYCIINNINPDFHKEFISSQYDQHQNIILYFLTLMTNIEITNSFTINQDGLDKLFQILEEYSQKTNPYEEAYDLEVINPYDKAYDREVINPYDEAYDEEVMSAVFGEEYVSGSKKDKESMTLSTLIYNTKSLGIDVISAIPEKSKSTKYTIIDSDQYPIILADDRDDITTINLDIQGETASCGDNALIFAAKAKQAGFDASILVQNGHAVVLIAHRENFSLDAILNTELADSESLLQQYKNAFLNSFESSKLIESLKDSIQFASLDIASKSYFPPHFDPPSEPFFNSNGDDNKDASAILIAGNTTSPAESPTS